MPAALHFPLTRRQALAAALAGLAAGRARARATPRIAALEWDGLENVIALGLTPVAGTDRAGWQKWVRTPAWPQGCADTGSRPEPDLARLKALKPDVIVCGPLQAAKLEALREIAPEVVYLENFRADAPHDQAETAKRQFLELGERFGRTQTAHRVVERLEASLAEARETLARRAPLTRSVQVIRFTSATSVLLYARNSVENAVVKALGLTQPGINMTR